MIRRKMKRSPPIPSKLSFLLCLLASAFLILAFTFFPTIRQRPHPPARTFTHDLISRAKSSSTCMFFACNLIIVAIILIGTSPPNDEDESRQESMQNLPFDGAELEHVDIESSSGYRFREEEEEIDMDIDSPRYEDEDEEEEDGSLGDEDDCCHKCDGDDTAELHERIEEFIAKTLNAWREEKSRDMQRLHHEGL